MNKKIPLFIVSVCVLFVIYVVTGVNNAISSDKGHEGMPGMEGNNEVGVYSISPKEIEDNISNENTVIVDLREPELYKSGHIPGSINIPYEEFKNRYVDLDSNLHIILICDTGSISQNSGYFLIQQGYKHVSSYTGGMENWNGELEK